MTKSLNTTTNRSPFNESPEAIILQARRMQRDAIIYGFKVAARWVGKIIDEIIDAHHKRKLMLELVKMDRDQLTDIGVLPGGIKEFVGKLAIAQPANDPANLKKAA